MDGARGICPVCRVAVCVCVCVYFYFCRLLYAAAEEYSEVLFSEEKPLGRLLWGEWCYGSCSVQCV